MNSAVYALIGNTADHLEYVTTALKKELCQNLTESCSTCALIDQRKHYQTLWLEPEKQFYARADFDLFFQAVSYERNSHTDRLFVVIQQAGRLSMAVANNLLKIFEEPPMGVTIYVLADTKESLLETILSRCVILSLAQATPSTFEHLKKCFTGEQSPSSTEFALWQLPNEGESRQVVDELLLFWRKKIDDTGQLGLWQVDFWVEARTHLPMSGSAKLFWRTQFLKWQSRMYAMHKA